MNKNRLDKGDAEALIISALQKSNGIVLSVEQLQEETKLRNKSTLYKALDRLVEKNKLIQVEDTNDKGDSIKKYQLITVNEKINEEYLNKLMDRYKEAEKSDNILFIKLAVADFTDICEFNKILYEKFIKFLIEHSKKDAYAKSLFLLCLTSQIYKYKNDVRFDINKQGYKEERKLIKLIKNSTQFIDEIIYNEHEPIDERVASLLALSEIDIKRAVDVSFILMKKLDKKQSIVKENKFRKKKSKKISEFEYFKSDIRKIILRYANVNYADCRIRILDELTKGENLEDEDISKELFDLYEFTKPAYEDRIEKSRFRTINPEDALKYQDFKKKLKEKGINVDD